METNSKNRKLGKKVEKNLDLNSKKVVNYSKTETKNA